MSAPFSNVAPQIPSRGRVSAAVRFACRRALPAWTAASLAVFCCAASSMRGAEEPPLRWIDGTSLCIGGKGWSETKGPFDRLPARAEGVVRGPVYSLGRDAAGVTVEFDSDTPVLRVRWKLRRERIAMPHMPATGVSGLDLYMRIDGEWRWIAVARPANAGENTSELFTDQPHTLRSFRLYLPLYNGVEKLELGVAPDAKIASGQSDPMPPLVFYGTSAVQGGCASRPGMSYPAIIGRRLHRTALNLGFDGNGKAEPETAALLATLTPAVYVIDCLPNLLPEEAPKVEAFVKTLRAARPTTPILLVENLRYTDAIFNAARRERYVASNRTLRAIFDRLSPADRNLHYQSSENFFGTDNDATVDGSHPTDLGFTRMAEVIAPVLQRLLGPPLHR